MAKGHTLVPGLRDAAKDAYLAAPNEDRQLAQFLGKLLEDAARSDQFEIVIELGEALIENNAGFREAPDLVGTAAFVVNDFDKAEKYLQIAKLNGTLIKESGGKYVDKIEDYRSASAEEEAIRRKKPRQTTYPELES